jgi:hypothetical protein
MKIDRPDNVLAHVARPNPDTETPMSKATEIIPLTRRLAIVPPREPDANLIAACQTFTTLTQATATLINDPDATGEQSEGVYEATKPRLRNLVGAITETPATTLAGQQARVQALDAFYEGDWSDFEENAAKGCWDSRMIWALIRDLLEVRQ